MGVEYPCFLLLYAETTEFGTKLKMHSFENFIVLINILKDAT